MTIGKFIQIHYQGLPVFIHIDHIVRVTQLTNGTSSITLDNKEIFITDETYKKVVGAIEKNYVLLHTGG